MAKMKITGYRKYTTKQGDAFDSIALEFYNDEFMASLLMAENPAHCDVLIFDAGTVINIPIVENVETTESLPPWRR